jgi:hypothetical protein
MHRTEAALSYTERTTMRKHRWVAIATGLLLVAALLGVAPQGTVHAAAQASQQWIGATGYFLGITSGGGSYIDHIHNVEAQTKCLDVPGSAFYQNHGLFNTELDASGAQVQLADCQPGDVQHDYDRNQIWNQQDNGDGSWTYFVTGAGIFCLDSLGLHGRATPIKVEQCSGANSQKWFIGRNGELQNVATNGYCADIDQATLQGDGNGAQVVLKPCGVQTNPAPAAPGSQTWTSANGTFFGMTSGGGGYRDHILNAAAPSKCLDVPGNHFYFVASDVLDIVDYLDASGTQVQLFDCQPADASHGFDHNQIWQQQDNGDLSWTYYVSGNQNFCLDSQNLQSSGSAVVVNLCNGGDAQKWYIGPSGQLESVASAGYCVDLNPATFQGDGNGVQVVLEPCTG